MWIETNQNVRGNIGVEPEKIHKVSQITTVTSDWIAFELVNQIGAACIDVLHS
jgi:hypothetical protein